MSAINTQIFTYEVVNSTFTITAAMSLRAVSFLLVSGNGNVTGDLRVGSIASIPLTLNADTPVTFTAGDVGVLEGEKLGNEIQSGEELAQLAEQWSYQEELEMQLGNEEDYESPEEAILAMAEYSGYGYEAEHALRASWLRAVRNGENPFKRASLLASLGTESLDADLLPVKEDSDE